MNYKHALAAGSFLLLSQRSFFENRLEGSVLFIGVQRTVSQWKQCFDDLIKPRAKSVEDYSDVLGLINLFGSHLGFGTNMHELRV